MQQSCEDAQQRAPATTSSLEGRSPLSLCLVQNKIVVSRCARTRLGDGDLARRH